jgi:TPR repeat protein
MYEQGRGVPRSFSEAARWFHTAAELGDAEAQCALGKVHRKGRGVPTDSAESVRWYRRAAEQVCR